MTRRPQPARYQTAVRRRRLSRADLRRLVAEYTASEAYARTLNSL